MAALRVTFSVRQQGHQEDTRQSRPGTVRAQGASRLLSLVALSLQRVAIQALVTLLGKTILSLISRIFFRMQMLFI